MNLHIPDRCKLLRKKLTIHETFVQAPIEPILLSYEVSNHFKRFSYILYFKFSEAIPDEHGRIPIPLPEIKIPITEPIEELVEGQGQSQGQYPRSTLAAPPTLPTFYNYQSPNNYAGYYYPQPPQPRPLPPPPTLDNKGYDNYRGQGGNYYDHDQGGQRQFSSDNSGLIQKLSTLFG